LLSNLQCQVRVETPSLKPEDVIMWCLVRAVTHFRGMVISWGKLKMLGRKKCSSAALSTTILT
jgi:hypothetical protein